jgi:glutamate/tyrosine decarboxylase-like PLP-dependent enzyme
MLGYPTTASGLLTSGCSMANLLALTVARNAKAGFDMRRQGIRSAPKQMILYTSEETHSSIQKAVELLGLGSDSIRNIPVNEYFQNNLEALKDAIVKDRENGFLPFCVVGAAGTVNTGAIDDLEAIADICQLEDLWFHIDGAFGAWAILSANANNLLAGMGRSDSLAFDLHKWMYMPYDIGCVLVRNARAHRDAFSLSPVYISRDDGGRGLSGGDLPWLTDYDFHLSRGFRALKAWMSLKEHGIRKYGRMIQKNLDQAQYLAKLIESAPELELAAPVPLNIVCFHYVQLGLEKDEIDRLNRKILVELQEQGIAVLSGTMVTGRYVLRAGITNHRSHRSDFELLVEQVIKTGDQVVASYSP